MTPLNIEDLERLLAEEGHFPRNKRSVDVLVLAQLLAAAREGEEAKDELQYQLKDAFVAGCCAVLTWTHSGMPQDDLDEAGYDYATTFLAHQALHPTPREGTL